MNLNGLKVVNLIHDDFEDLELWYPVLRLREAGVMVHLVGEQANTKYKGKYGVPATSDFGFSEINIAEYDGILVPGGWAPDKLRRFPEVIKLVQDAHHHKKIIGQICHAGWVLISAKILNGMKVTSTPGIKDDMENAGAIWLDEPVVIDGNIISSRRPSDLPQYMQAILEALSQKVIA
jgi:protease I